MVYANQRTILQRTAPDGVIVAILEGLNTKENLEVVLTIPPELQLAFDERPSFFDKWQFSGSMLYFGKNPRGVVHFYSYSGPGRGFGGAKITVPTIEGEEILVGPWSSRCGVMNHVFQASMEVVLAGRYRMASAMTFDALDRYVHLCGFTCDMRNESDGDWTPCLVPLVSYQGAKS